MGQPSHLVCIALEIATKQFHLFLSIVKYPDIIVVACMKNVHLSAISRVSDELLFDVVVPLTNILRIHLLYEKRQGRCIVTFDVMQVGIACYLFSKENDIETHAFIEFANLPHLVPGK